MNKTTIGLISLVLVAVGGAVYVATQISIPLTPAAPIVETPAPAPVTQTPAVTPTTPTTPAPTTPASATKSYTLAQVAAHSTSADCWIVIRNKVYNLSNFASEHPGGSQPILNSCGKDGTALFSKQSAHTQQAVLDELASVYLATLAN